MPPEHLERLDHLEHLETLERRYPSAVCFGSDFSC